MDKRMASRPMRSSSGGSLVEMLVCTVLISKVAAASMTTLVAQNKVAQKFGNKMDALNAERIAVERIGRDVRQARSLGDVFGAQVPFTVNGEAMLLVEGTDQFPSNNNPIYLDSAPPNGWPSWSTDGDVTGPGRWKLSNTTLIVQVPIFDSNGFPTRIPQNAYGAGRPQSSQANVETHIYRVVASDQSQFPGESQMEYVIIPGMAVDNPGAAPDYVPASAQRNPQVLVKGIVGPLNSSGSLAIFQYLDRTDSTGAARNMIATPATVANYTGVLVNLELRKHEQGQIHDAVVGFKTEVFLRNNALATETAN